MSRESLIVGRDLPSPSLVDGHAPAAVEVARRAEAAAAHLARVAASADVAQVYGALVDLFIATPPELVETRAAALERYERALSQAEHQALADAVVTGLDPTSVIPPCPCSMFSAGVTQGIALVRHPEPVTPVEPEPMPELESEAGTDAPRGLELVADQPTALALPEPAALALIPPAALELVPEQEAVTDVADAAPAAETEATVEPMPAPSVDRAPSPAVAALAPVPERRRPSVGSVLAGLGAAAVVLRALRRRRNRG